MLRRLSSVTRRGAFAVLATLAALVPLAAQDLLAEERRALTAHAGGDLLAAADALLDAATRTAADPDGDADQAARVEAWASAAARWSVGSGDVARRARFDALVDSPLAQRHPLLRDALGLVAMAAAGAHPTANTRARAEALGFVRAVQLIGPFANERGAGFRTAEPPEQGIDLAAEHPGKRRPVRWRELPPRDLWPAWPLHRLVAPHEQSLAYVATVVLAPRAMQAVLLLGSTGSVRVFCNGAEVFAREVERRFEPDQDALVLPLAAGANRLLVKFCHQEGNEFRATLRLRGVDGGPLRDVRCSAQAADFAAAATTQPPTDLPAIPVPVPVGGRTHWRIGSVRGADALRLAWLWQWAAADGDTDRRDAAAAAAAATELPALAITHLLVADSLRRHQRSAADRDENDRRRALERALQAEPDHAVAHSELGDLLLSTSDLWREARSHAARVLQRAPRHTAAILLHAATLRREGLVGLADAEVIAAAARPDAPMALSRAAAELLRDREPAKALVLWRQLLALDQREDHAVETAWLLARTGADQDALALLQATLERDPFALRARVARSELLLRREDGRAALDTLTPWLALHPDDADACVLASRACRLLQDVDAAAAERQLQLLQQALAVAPNRRDDERYAEYLASAVAGHGDADGNAFYAEWKRDAAATLQQDAGPPADAAAANDPLHWVLRQHVVRANGNGTTAVYQHWIARVLTTEGARTLRSYRLPHWSSEQRARLLSCTVFRADGSVQRPALQGASVRLPDLRPGDAVAIEGRVDDLAPSFFGDYFGYVHTFASDEGSPLRFDELIVLAEPGRDYQVQAVHGAPQPERTVRADGMLQFRCSMQDLGRDEPEVMRPDRKEYEPTVRITTYRDWDHFAAWWWNLIKAQLEVTPPMRATVARVCAGLTDTEAKVAAIYHFVTTDVRYEAWEFGVHGYKPYSTAIIHERRHGDCKDKALLLCALLGEIGVPCHPVLIFADTPRSQDDLALPMVQHFNHCIAWLPPHEGRPGRFLDGTATWHPTDTLPEMDQGATVLVVAAGRAELQGVPWTTPGANLATVRHEVELRADGSARVRQDEQPRGNAAIELRAMLGTEPARRREVVERQLVQKYGKATLADLQADTPADPEAPVRLVATVDLAELGQRSATAWQLPSAWSDGNLLAWAADADRKRPLLLGVPNGDVQEIVYRLPAGWRLGELPAAVTATTTFGSFVMRWERRGSELRITRALQLAAPRIQPTEYPAFREFLSTVKAADTQLVLLQPEAR